MFEEENNTLCGNKDILRRTVSSEQFEKQNPYEMVALPTQSLLVRIVPQWMIAMRATNRHNRFIPLIQQFVLLQGSFW